MSTQHTPGPWEIDEVDKGFSAQILGPSTGFCRDILATLPMEWAESEANARLIAAAPELLEALQKIATVDMGGGFLGAQACRKVALAAIAKARGEA